MDPSLQQHPLSHFTSFVQKTPIPSQLPNRLSHPPPKVSLQTSPEVCNRNTLSQNLHVAGKKSTSPLVNSPTNIVSPVNSFAKGILVPMKNRPPSHGYNLGSPVSVTTARENTGPQQNMMQSGKGWFSPPEVVLTSLTQTSAETQNRPKILGSTSHQHQKNLNNHLPSCLSGRDHEPMILSSNSGKSSDVSQRQESNKGQQHDQTRSSKSTIPVMDLNNTSAKRRREGEPCLKNTKKPCLKGTNHGTTEVTKLTPGTSPVSSLDPQPSPRSSSVLESSPEPLDKLLKSESPYPRLSSVCKPSRLSSTCSKKTRSTGAKQGFITTENNVIKLRLSSTLSKESPKKQHGENLKKEESSSVKVNEESGKPPHVGLVSKISDNKDHTVPVKTGSKLNGSTLKPASKQSISSLSCSTPERSKSNRVQKPVALLNDIEQLFTPDPKVYIVKPPRLTPKSKMEEETIKSSILTKGSSPPSSSSPTVTPVSLPVKQPQLVASSQTSTLTLCLESLKLEKHNTGSKDRAIRRSSDNSSIRQSTENSKPQPSLTPKPKTNEGLCGSETDTSASVHKTSTSCTKSPQLKEKENNENKEVKEEDSIVVDLDLDLSISYGIDITQSTDSSEEEPLISFQEIMERVTKPPDTPQKEAFSEPSTPGCHSSRSKTCPQPSTTKPEVYKNSLDQMLKEINSSKKAKELEEQLLSACNIDLLRLAEYEEAEENQVEITTEHQEFLHHVSLMSAAIREVPPGEEIFNLEKFGQIFNQDTLQLRQCFVEPQGTSQKTLLWSSPAQLKLHLNIGLFEEAYCSSPCPAQVTRFLFKMMSVHRERIISDKILQALCAIACSAAYQIVNNESQQFEVWVPSLADVTLVFMNMGAAFVTLFPFESLQPLFTEGDLLLDVYIDSESSCKKEEINFPKHSCTNILKYLSYCVGLCTHAYSDDELLLLLTVVGRISLETRQIPWPSEEVSCLLYKMVNNIRDWSSMLPRVCKALTDLTDDHHNMCLLVQLLPDSTRGKQLRRHLSMCYISKLLDGSCTYRPIQQELQLAELRPYLPQMQPSALLQSLQQKDKEEDMATLDQQAYYLCYSLLTLTNEASNLLVFKTDQKAQLLVLSSELETHVKCDIRESEKCLYRSKVKDLVARIYTKWQMLLQKTRPLNGKLYDYWQPVEAFRNTNVDGEEHFIEDDDDDEEATIIHENDIETGKNEEDEQEKMEVKEDEVVENLEDDTKTREATVAVEQVADDFNQTAPLMLCPAVDEKIDPGLKECTDMEHETAGGEEISPPDVIM